MCAHISCGKHTQRAELKSSPWITHVASQVLGYCDALNSLSGILEPWLSTRDWYSYIAVMPRSHGWETACVRHYKKNKDSLLPHSFCLIHHLLRLFLPACFVAIAQMFSTLQQYAEHMIEICPGIQPPWEVHSYSLDTVDVAFWGLQFFLCSFPENSLHHDWLQSFFCTCLGLKGGVKYCESCKHWGISLPVSNRKRDVPAICSSWIKQHCQEPQCDPTAHYSAGSQKPMASFLPTTVVISSEPHGFILTAVAWDFHEFCGSKIGVIWLRKSCQVWVSPFLSISELSSISFSFALLISEILHGWYKAISYLVSTEASWSLL